MRWIRTLTVATAHTEGEANDVIVGGVLPPPGNTMFQRMQHMQDHADELRQLLLFEPRGAVTRCVNLVTPPCDPRADAGVIIMESRHYVPMSGSNIIATATVLLETGMLPMREPETTFTLDTPGGLVKIHAECGGGRCRRITFQNVPAFVLALDHEIEVPGLGKLRIDVAYGGMLYALVDAANLGLELVPREARVLVQMGERIKAAAAAQVPAVHPENPEIYTINQTLFAGPLSRTPDGWQGRNTVVVSPGRLDRSPCGTGTSARLAVLHAHGQVRLGEQLEHVSIIGSRFVGRIEGEVRVGNGPAVVTSISGRAWITGITQCGLDPDDPFPRGYTLGDTWFD